MKLKKNTNLLVFSLPLYMPYSHSASFHIQFLPHSCLVFLYLLCLSLPVSLKQSKKLIYFVYPNSKYSFHHLLLLQYLLFSLFSCISIGSFGVPFFYDRLLTCNEHCQVIKWLHRTCWKGLELYNRQLDIPLSLCIDTYTMHTYLNVFLSKFYSLKINRWLLITRLIFLKLVPS